MERAALLAVALFAFVPLPYIDRGTTLTVNPVTVLVVWAALAVPATLVFARYWFRRRPDLDQIPHWHLKHDSPGRWVLVFIGMTMLMGALIGGCAYMYVQAITPHVSGREVPTAATVTSIQPVFGRNRRCERRATFFIRGRGDVESCIQPWMGDTVRVDEPVTLTIVVNAFGTAVVKIDPRR